jgi:hypothetical protein
MGQTFAHSATFEIIVIECLSNGRMNGDSGSKIIEWIGMSNARRANGSEATSFSHERADLLRRSD